MVTVVCSHPTADVREHERPGDDGRAEAEGGAAEDGHGDPQRSVTSRHVVKDVLKDVLFHFCAHGQMQGSRSAKDGQNRR